jgi:hypothetical protein
MKKNLGSPDWARPEGTANLLIRRPEHCSDHAFRKGEGIIPDLCNQSSRALVMTSAGEMIMMVALFRISVEWFKGNVVG